MLFRQLNRLIHSRQHHRTAITHFPFRTNIIQSTTANHRLKGALIDLAAIHSGTEVKQIFKRPTLSARRYDIVYRAFTQPFDSAKAVNHTPGAIDTKVKLPMIDIRGQQIQTHSPAFIDKGHHLVGFIHIR